MKEDDEMQKENKRLEYKETISKTYLKTVSAFANFNDGEIIFGITDDYRVVGIDFPNDSLRRITIRSFEINNRISSISVSSIY